jgi:hypothetical protein
MVNAHAVTDLSPSEKLPPPTVRLTSLFCATASDRKSGNKQHAKKRDFNMGSPLTSRFGKTRVDEIGREQ